MEEILDDLFSRGEFINKELMKNGETRYRTRIFPNFTLSKTISGDSPEWQNAHYHNLVNEVYFVRKGKLLLVMEENSKITYKFLYSGNSIIIKPKVKHNVYLFNNTIINVIKYGKNVESDWYFDNNLNTLSRKLNFE